MSGGNGYTTLKLGYTNPQTGVFGAHPQLGAALDLNDGVTFTLVSPDGLELSAPEKTLVPSGNIRTQGERITRAIYRRNRTAVARLIFGPAANYASFIASVRALIRWIDAAPSVPVTLQWQPPSATSPVYLDIVGAAHALPADEREWLRLQVEPIELVFVARPGLRGDRLTLSNLVVNPGFEAGSGPGVNVFTDTFANANAYTQQFGGAPSVSANQLTVAANSALRFGSPSWGAINQWRLRWRWNTGLTAYLHLHYTDGNNWLAAVFDGVTMSLIHAVGGTQHTLATAAAALGTGGWYWLSFTQFPSAPGTQPDVVATLYNDSGGAAGSQIATSGVVATYDGVTALAGQSALQANGAIMLVGGAFSSVHTVALFGPGGWGFAGYDTGATGEAAGGWEQATANTYGGGATTSYGAARIDVAPAGALSAYWDAPGAFSPLSGNLTAIPATTGQTLTATGWARSSGLGVSAQVKILLIEYDINGSGLRSTTTTLNGNQAVWTQLSVTAIMGASTAYVSVRFSAVDATSGSANGTIWIDNAQCWNVTTTGQSSMPYCELRFTQSPAQLLITGLQGDLPAPAYLAWGTFLASWGVGSTLSYALGRRGRADGTAAAARLVGTSHGYYGAGVSPQATAILDASSYGGYYPTVTLGNGWNPRAFSFAPSDALGSYHVLSRFWTAEGAGNLPNVQTRAVTQQRSQAWYGQNTSTDQLGAYYGPFVAPISASATWTIADSGPLSSPALPTGALTDLTQNFLTPRSQWADFTGGGATARANWQMLLPVDGSLVMGLLNNPSNAPFGVTNQWLWVYQDGLLTNRAAVGDTAATTYSLEGSALPNPAHAGGGPGTSGTGVINVNSGADPQLTLDPTLALASTSTAAGGAGVNQLAGYVADNAGAVLPLMAEIVYSPLYLYPR